MIYLAREQWDLAIHLNEDALKRDSTDINSWLEIGDIERMKGDTTCALNTYHAVGQQFPDDWRPYFEIGRIHLDRQNYPTALEKFLKVTELSKDTFWGWLFSGITLVSMDSTEESQMYLRKCLDIVPRHPLGNYFLGTVLAQENQVDEAIPYLETALEIRPDWVAALIPLAGTYETIKNYTVSDSLFNRALHLDPENALLLNNYGYSLCERGVRLEEAIEMAEKALSIDPENGAYLDTVGWIYYKLGEYEKARGYIEKAFEVRTDSADVLDHLGEIYHKLEMKQKAREIWEKALALDQNNNTIRNKLNQLFGN